MLSSLVYTLTFDSLYEHHASFEGATDRLCTVASLSYYPLKIVVLTVAVMATWLVVMYLTQPDDDDHLRKFVNQTGTGGWWPNSIAKCQYLLGKRVALCAVFGVTYLMPFLFIWQFKFGDRLIGLVLSGVFIILSTYVYRALQQLLDEKIGV